MASRSSGSGRITVYCDLVFEFVGELGLLLGVDLCFDDGADEAFGGFFRYCGNAGEYPQRFCVQSCEVDRWEVRGLIALPPKGVLNDLCECRSRSDCLKRLQHRADVGGGMQLGGALGFIFGFGRFRRFCGHKTYIPGPMIKKSGTFT